MDAFSYLSVLLSIILGLAITQILQGYRALLLARHAVGRSALPLVWSGLLLVFVTQAWWASFGLADRTDWQFDEFLVILVQMALLYMAAAVVLPDAPAGERIDLDAHFERNRGVFFGFLIAVVVASLLKDLVLDGTMPGGFNLAFHAMLALTGAIGMTVSNRAVQWTLAGAAAASTTAYIVVLFARL